MKSFDVFCRLTNDSDYCKTMIEKYGEEDLNALSFLIANKGLGFSDSAPVIISRPGWEGGCSPDISEWCHLKGIEVKDFNHPVEIDPHITNLSYAFHGCEWFWECLQRLFITEFYNKNSRQYTYGHIIGNVCRM